MNLISNEEILAWCMFIKQICGLRLDLSKAYLIETRLQHLLDESGIDSWLRFLDIAKADTSGKYKRRIIDSITTHETSFFRDQAPFDLLRNKLIPDLIDIRKNQTPAGKQMPIRILSAACSTGQEVYSIAIILKELLYDFKEYDIRIFGTDISDCSISQASKGLYSQLEISRGLSADRLERFFVHSDEQFRIRDELRFLATFKCVNLLEPQLFPNKFDIIFCRNVAVYFDEIQKKKLFNNLAQYLAPDGYLIIGSTESLLMCCPSYRQYQHCRATYYRMI